GPCGAGPGWLATPFRQRRVSPAMTPSARGGRLKLAGHVGECPATGPDGFHEFTVWPPSTTIAWPVMYDDASLARNTAGPAISSALAQRCIGTVAIVAGPVTGSSHRLRFRSVAVQPGHSALTLTPSAAHSTASDFVREISPALAAPYGLISG